MGVKKPHAKRPAKKAAKKATGNKTTNARSSSGRAEKAQQEAPNIKITAKQIRFKFRFSGQVWAIQPLHIAGGVPAELRGDYSVPLDEERRHAWGQLDGKLEEKILRQWLKSGFKL